VLTAKESCVITVNVTGPFGVQEARRNMKSNKEEMRRFTGECFIGTTRNM
jgi:hypothetical protein